MLDTELNPQDDQKRWLYLVPTHFQVLHPTHPASLQSCWWEDSVSIQMSQVHPCLLTCTEWAELQTWLIPLEKQWGWGVDLSYLGPSPSTGWGDLVQHVAKGKGQNDNCLPAGIWKVSKIWFVMCTGLLSALWSGKAQTLHFQLSAFSLRLLVTLSP